MPGTPASVTSRAQARQLVEILRNAQRKFPVVVVTTRAGGGPHFDADQVAQDTIYRADVYLVPSGFTDQLNDVPGSAGVFDGAARVYPPGVAWHRNPGLSRFFLADVDDMPTQHRLLVEEALSQAPGRGRAPVSGKQDDVSPVPPTAVPVDGVRRVVTPAQADELVRLLADPGRQRPVVVVTIPAQNAQPYIDPTEIAAAAPGLVDVYLVATGALTYRISNAIGALAGVYGGAGRMYATGNRWLIDPYVSKLRFAYDKSEGTEATDKLIGDVLGAASEWIRPAPAPVAVAPTTGVVRRLVRPSRALVTTDNGDTVTVWSELVLADHPIERVVCEGMQVTGELDPVTHRLDVRGMHQVAAEALREFDQGSVVLGRVHGLSADRALVELFPGVVVSVTVEQVTGNPLDHLDDLMSDGETLAVRVVESGVATGTWRLSLRDVDDSDEVVSAPALLVGGPPWLALPSPADRLEAPPAAARPREIRIPVHDQVLPGPPVRAAVSPVADVAVTPVRPVVVDELAMENRALREDNRRQLERVRLLESQNERLRADVRNAKAKARKREVLPATETKAFVDAEEQLRWDILRAWVDGVSPAEKASLPLPTYTVGPQFITSLQVEGISRSRVLAVVVDVLLGRKKNETHPLRRSEGGDSPPVSRPDGAVCLRTNLQTNTPSARRLHYWKGPGSAIELSRVVLHDDMDP